MIIVGGAGILFVDEAQTIRLADTPEFPKEYFATSNQGKNLEVSKREQLLTGHSSACNIFQPRNKGTGFYQKGKDNPIVNSKGDSYVSYADFAIAVLDEIENPQHINERFTIVLLKQIIRSGISTKTLISFRKH